MTYLRYLVLLSGLTSASASSPQLNLPPAFESQLSLLVTAAQDGQIIYQHNAQQPRLIASNMKLFTTWLGLNHLGADYHWHTKLYYAGSINQHTLNGNLYLLGSGDPTLASADLYFMFSQLQQLGITQIKGNIILDDSIFTHKPTYSMLHNQAYDSDSVLPNGIIIDDQLTHLYLEQESTKAKFNLRSNLYGYHLINNLQINKYDTACNNIYSKIHLELTDENLTISGKLSPKCQQLDLSYNLLPAFNYNQNKLQQILANLHLKLKGNYQHQQLAKQQLHLIYDHTSASLEAVLLKMNRFSNNLMATTILLSSAQQVYPQLDNQVAANKLFMHFINEHNLSNPQAQLENGAGLSRHEYFSAQNVVDLLTLANNSWQQANFEASLATSAQEGTLAHEYTQFSQQIHAKTGTLDDVKALSGYFYAKSGKKYIFSLILNDFDTTLETNTQIFNNLALQLFTQLN